MVLEDVYICPIWICSSCDIETEPTTVSEPKTAHVTMTENVVIQKANKLSIKTVCKILWMWNKVRGTFFSICLETDGVLSIRKYLCSVYEMLIMGQFWELVLSQYVCLKHSYGVVSLARLLKQMCSVDLLNLKKAQLQNLEPELYFGGEVPQSKHF